MGYLYLVGFKGQPYGREDDLNYALRELLDEHCSFCEPAGRYNTFENAHENRHLSEICWLMQETRINPNSLIDVLRNKYEEMHGHQPESWFETFHSRQRYCTEQNESDERRARWKKDRYWIFRRLIGSWIKPRRRFPKEQED